MAIATAASRVVDQVVGKSSAMKALESIASPKHTHPFLRAHRLTTNSCRQFMTMDRLVGKGIIDHSMIQPVPPKFGKALAGQLHPPKADAAIRVGGTAGILSATTLGAEFKSQLLGLDGVAAAGLAGREIQGMLKFLTKSNLGYGYSPRGTALGSRLSQGLARGVVDAAGVGTQLSALGRVLAGTEAQTMVRTVADSLIVKDGLRGHAAAAGLAARRPALPDLSSLWRLPPQVQTTFDRWREMFERRQNLEQRLADTPAHRLVFILDHMGFGYAMRLMERMADRGIEPLVDLLEQVLMEAEVLARLDAAVQDAQLLRPGVRRHLRHGIGHLQAGEFHDALPPLLIGLEGALRDGARAQSDNKAFPNARSAIMVIKFDAPQELYLRQVVYATGQGNNVRHGEDADSRRLSVFALVGLLLWLERFTSLSTMLWLGRNLEAELRAQLAET
jgi:hypothetical protein